MQTNRPNGVATRYAAVMSNPDLLVKNLRLLDLDEEFDWPHITSTTFAVNDSVKNLNTRLFCTAWILYKLFEIYDPEKTKRELRDLFPPFEPKQSSLLRSAVFKRLYELKSTGFFGKEIVVRKTMFEDCKGPKFEELLAVFSSAVLIKAIQLDKTDLSVVKASIGSPQAHLDQVSLVVAYRASLSMQLQTREALQRRWLKFARTIENNKEMLEQRVKGVKPQSKASPQKRIPQRTINRLKKCLSENWTGDDQWIEILLQSDRHRTTGTFLKTPYEEVWQHACKDTLYALRPQESNSRLQILEGRIQEQKLRLDRWKTIQNAIESLNQKQKVEGKTSAAPETSVAPRKQSLRSNKLNQPLPRKRSVGNAVDEFTTPKSTISRDAKHRRSRSAVVELPKAKGPSPTVSPLVRLRNTSVATDTKTKSHSRITRSTTAAVSANRPSSSRKSNSSVEGEVTIPVASRVEFDQELLGDVSETFSNENSSAADIVNSVLHSISPPYKAPLTLAERTRISMATMGAKQEPVLSDQGVDHKNPLHIESVPGTPKADLSDLAQRTRKSMSIRYTTPAPSARQTSKARPSAVYPINQFETPGKPLRTADDSVFDETTINLDEEDIFKSRPKVAVSPTLSPMAGDEYGSIVKTILEDESYEDDFS